MHDTNNGAGGGHSQQSSDDHGHIRPQHLKTLEQAHAHSNGDDHHEDDTQHRHFLVVIRVNLVELVVFVEGVLLVGLLIIKVGIEGVVFLVEFGVRLHVLLGGNSPEGGAVGCANVCTRVVVDISLSLGVDISLSLGVIANLGELTSAGLLKGAGGKTDARSRKGCVVHPVKFFGIVAVRESIFHRCDGIDGLVSEVFIGIIFVSIVIGSIVAFWARDVIACENDFRDNFFIFRAATLIIG